MDQHVAKPSENPVSAEATHDPPTEKKSRRCKGKKPRRVPTGTPRATKFVGSPDALKDHNYDLSYNMSDQYTKTTRVISEYVGREYKNRSEIKSLIKLLNKYSLTIPANLTQTQVTLRIWER